MNIHIHTHSLTCVYEHTNLRKQTAKAEKKEEIGYSSVVDHVTSVCESPGLTHSVAYKDMAAHTYP